MRSGAWGKVAQVPGIECAGTYQARPARVFGFGELPEAHRIMEAGTAGGKMAAAVD